MNKGGELFLTDFEVLCFDLNQVDVLKKRLSLGQLSRIFIFTLVGFWRKDAFLFLHGLDG